MDSMIVTGREAVSAWRKAGRAVSRVFFACLLVLMAALVFFLLQSRLAGGAPAVAGHQIYIVLSGSMSPAFKAGSIILVRPLEPAEVRVGDIITYREPDPEKPGAITTHRVVAVQPTDPVSFTTRGDANDAADPLPVPAGQRKIAVYLLKILSVRSVVIR